MDRNLLIIDATIEIKAIAKFLYYDGYTAVDAHKKISEQYTISLRSIEIYYQNIENGTFSLFSKKHPGRPKNNEKIDEIRKFVDDNSYTTTREIEENLNISKSDAS